MQETDTFFESLKSQTINKLEQAIDNHEVDKKVIPILKILNKQDAYCTTSSCAGRVIILQLPEVGDKKHAIYLGRWHHSISFIDVKQALASFQKGQVWFIAQSPIFHIASRTLTDADALVKLGISAGFKNSGFKSNKNRIVVELCSTERMDVPLGTTSEVYISDAYLHFLIEIGNDLLLRGQKKLNRLKRVLEKNYE